MEFKSNAYYIYESCKIKGTRKLIAFGLAIFFTSVYS